MVKERGFVDNEAGASMRYWGWLTYKKRDAVVCPKCGYIVIPGGPPGTFDFPEVQIPSIGGDPITISVEVKAGDTSFAFSELRENQREWAESSGNICYIWLCLGRGNVNAKIEPRRTYLIPYTFFLDVEEALERKSIPYDLYELDVFRLEWKGDGKWVMPRTHPLRLWLERGIPY